SVSYRRDLIGEVHVNPYNNHVAIPIREHAQVEFHVSDEKSESHDVAAAIAAALGKHPPAVDRADADIVDEMATGGPSAAQTGVFVTMICAAVVGLAVSIGLGACAGLGVFILCLIPCGIFLGTQEKKFWL